MRSPVLLCSSVADIFKTPNPGGSGCSDIAHLRADCDVIVWSAAGHGAVPTRVQASPSVRAVWNGSETYTIGRRTLCVDEDCYLVINGGREYLTPAQGRDWPESLTVFFSRQTQRAQDAPERDLFAEHLQPHDELVTPYLRSLADACRRGVTDDAWYAEQVAALYAALVAANDELHRKAAAFAAASATRTELLRRVMTATDYVNSNYMDAVNLDDIACAAHLSKYHLARLFRALHGVSPAAYVRLKRIKAAERLIERSDADLSEIAERSGFGSRWSMFRELRRRRGMSGQRIRDHWTSSTARAISPGV